MKRGIFSFGKELVSAMAVFALALALCAGCGGSSETPYETPDNTAPYVVTVSPTVNQSDVGINCQLTVTFNEAMDNATITSDTYTLLKGSDPISGSISFGTGTAVFTLSGPLEYSTVYTAVIKNEVKDLAGNNLSGDYTWQFTTVSAPGPEIHVKKGTMDVFTGSANVHDFGSVIAGGSSGIETFTILNQGSMDLLLNGTPTVDSSNVEFVVETQPETPIAGSGSDDFTLSFKPIGAGEKTATITIYNNDGNENPYTFTVKGTGTEAPEPEIQLMKGISDVPSGTLSAHDYGNVLVGQMSSTVTFTIKNNGNADLNLSGTPRVTSSSTEFSIDSQPNSPVGEGEETTFTVTFRPTGTGAKTSTITIINDDTNEGTFIFTVIGNGITASSDADLSGLTINQGTMEPVFSSGIVNYLVKVTKDVNAIKLTPTAHDLNYSSIEVKVNDGDWNSMSSGIQSGDLNVADGKNTIKVRVTAQDGVTKKEYSISLRKQYFRTIDSTGNVGSGCSIAVNNNNEPYISYADYTNFDLKIAYRYDGLWNVYTAASANMQGYNTSIAMDSNNKYYISYYHYTNNRLSYLTSDTPWYTGLDTIVAGTMFSTSIDVDSNSKSHISYLYDDGVSVFAIKYATNNSGSWVYESIESSATLIGDYSSIKIDLNGYPHVVYRARNVSGDGITVYATRQSGSWVKTIIDNTCKTYGRNGLVLDGNDKAHVVYYDSNAGDLSYATNMSGSWIVTRIDQTGDVGINPAIDLDSNSSKHICYFDMTNGSLKYITDRTGTWYSISLDTGCGFSSYSNCSIAMDADNVLHVCYFDSINGDLKYMEW